MKTVFEDGAIVIYETTTGYLFTTIAYGVLASRRIDNMTLKEIIENRYGIEYDVLEVYR